MDFPFLFFLLPDTDCRKKGTDTDTCRAQVADLIYFQASIYFPRTGENIVDLVGGNRIQTAAKRV